MNRLLTNKYLSGRNTPLAEYSLDDYIKGDICIARPGTPRDVSVSAGCLVAMTGFNVSLAGTGYLITLLSGYIVHDNFDIDEAIKYISLLRHSEPSYIRSSIEAAIRFNTKFTAVITSLLGTEVNAERSIDSVLEMLAAAYVIYYNYTDVEDNFDYSVEPDVFDIWRETENGQRKKH